MDPFLLGTGLFILGAVVWVVCAIFCASGFALFYRDFLQFFPPS